MAKFPFAPYHTAIHRGLILQLVVMVLLSLLLDFGRMASIGWCALAGFWIGAGLIMLRRPRAPRWLDLAYIRYGFVGAFVAAVLLTDVLKPGY